MMDNIIESPEKFILQLVSNNMEPVTISNRDAVVSIFDNTSKHYIIIG